MAAATDGGVVGIALIFVVHGDSITAICLASTHHETLGVAVGLIVPVAVVFWQPIQIVSTGQSRVMVPSGEN